MPSSGGVAVMILSTQDSRLKNVGFLSAVQDVSNKQSNKNVIATKRGEKTCSSVVLALSETFRVLF